MSRKQQRNQAHAKQTKFSVNDRLQKLRNILSHTSGPVTTQSVLHKVNAENLHRNYVVKKEAVKTHTSQLNNRLKQFRSSLCKSKNKPTSKFHSSTYARGTLPNSDRASMKEMNNDLDRMDWSNIEEEQLILDLNKLRKGTEFSDKPLPQTSSENCNTNIGEKDVCLVVDTNIFLKHLDVISTLENIKCNQNAVGPQKLHIMIPWIVLQELDYLKDGKSHSRMEKKAQQAVKYINTCLSSNSSCMRGQTVTEALHVNYSSSNPDDGVLTCCLQMLKNSELVILLSNDINLRNKALVHGIKADSSETIIESCKRMNLAAEKDSKTKTVQSRMASLLSYLLQKELDEAYGPVWTKFSLLQTGPPWNFKQCLNIMKKYWQSVFSLKVHKQVLKIISDFDETEGNINVNGLIDFCLTLLMHLKNGLKQYANNIGDCVHDIQLMKQM